MLLTLQMGLQERPQLFMAEMDLLGRTWKCLK